MRHDARIACLFRRDLGPDVIGTKPGEFLQHLTELHLKPGISPPEGTISRWSR